MIEESTLLKSDAIMHTKRSGIYFIKKTLFEGSIATEDKTCCSLRIQK